MDRVITAEELLESYLPFSRSTLDREVRAARAGISDFPIPLLKKGKKLVFSLRRIEMWIARQQAIPPDIVPPETPAAREARCKAARQELKQLGIKTSTQQKRGRSNANH